MLTSGVFGYLTDYLLWCVLFVSVVLHTWCFFRFFPRQRLVKSGLVIGNGLIFMCMLGFAALVGETYFRFVCVETDSFGVSLPAQRWFALHVRLNSLGCRDGEWSAASGDSAGATTRRIAFVGDSFTYGWGIERVEDRFPDLIEARLHTVQTGRTGNEKVAQRVEVMNVAKPGWGTGDQLQPVTDVIDVYGVDEVVLCYVPNDIEKLLPRSDDFDPIRPPEPKLINPSTSCLFDYLYHHIVVPRLATVRHYHDWLAGGFADPDIWRAHQEQLFAIATLCRDRGVAFRVALLPYIQTGGSVFDSASLHATLRAFFERNGVPVVDLLPLIASHDPADLMVNAHDAHPNEKANQIFAEAIWEAFYAAQR